MNKSNEGGSPAALQRRSTQQVEPKRRRGSQARPRSGRSPHPNRRAARWEASRSSLGTPPPPPRRTRSLASLKPCSGLGPRGQPICGKEPALRRAAPPGPAGAVGAGRPPFLKPLPQPSGAEAGTKPAGLRRRRSPCSVPSAGRDVGKLKKFLRAFVGKQSGECQLVRGGSLRARVRALSPPRPVAAFAHPS